MGFETDLINETRLWGRFPSVSELCIRVHYNEFACRDHVPTRTSAEYALRVVPIHVKFAHVGIVALSLLDGETRVADFALVPFRFQDIFFDRHLLRINKKF